MKTKIGKKLLGIFLSIACAAATLTPVLAEDSVETGKPAGWSGNDSYMATTEESYSGKSSLKLSGVGDGSELVQSIDYDSEKSYKITLYAKTTGLPDWKWMAKAWLGLEATAGEKHISHLNEDGWTITPVENDWNKFEVTFKPGDEDSKRFHIRNAIIDAVASVFVAYIDDLSVYEIDDAAGNTVGENLIKNGGFEQYQMSAKPADWSGNTYYLTTTEDSYSGFFSVKMGGVADTTELVQNVDYNPDKSYKVTLYAKTTGLPEWKWMAKAWLGKEGTTVDNGVQHLNDTGWTVTPVENGWNKFESTYKPGDDDSKYFHIKSAIIEAVASVFVAYIDDLSVYEVDETTGDTVGENLIKNGGFEQISEPKPELSVTSGNGSLTINWTNPYVASTAAKVYVDNEEISVPDVKLEANAQNSVTVDGLENFREYSVKVVMSTALGTQSAETTAMPKKTILGTAADWSENLSYTTTTEDSHSGIVSIKMSGLMDNSSELSQSVNFDPAKTYKLSLYAKPSYGWSWLIGAWLGDYNTKYPHINEWNKSDADADGWIRYEVIYQPGKTGEETSFHIRNQSTDPRFYAFVDDVEVYEYDTQNNVTVSENLIKNGGFETYTELTYDEGVKYGYIDKEGCLFWVNDSSANPSYYKIYKLTDGEWTFIGATESNTEDYYVLDDYSEGDRYLVKSYYETEDTETSGVELKDEVIIYGIFAEGTVDDNGIVKIEKEISNIQSGDIISGVEIVNNTENAISPNAYIALYNGTKLIGVQKLSTVIAARDTEIHTAKLAANVNVPEGDGYSIKVMTFNDEITPIGDFKALK